MAMNWIIIGNSIFASNLVISLLATPKIDFVLTQQIVCLNYILGLLGGFSTRSGLEPSAKFSISSVNVK